MSNENTAGTAGEADLAGQGIARPSRGTNRRLIAAALAGNFVEWYDFSVYAYFAVVLAPKFFPSGNSTVALLNTFAAFGIAFLFRLVGALVFGRLGDRLGRRATMLVVVLLMSAATAVIGLLPGYAQIGVAAPVLLVAARALQGLSAGGEYASASAYLVESAPTDRRGLAGAWAYFGIGLALVVGALLGVVINAALPAAEVASWGWRIAFLLSAPFGLIGFALRRTLGEGDAFAELKQDNLVAGSPLLTSLRTQLGRIVLAIGLVIVGTAQVYLVLLYLPTYLHKQSGLSLSSALLANVIGLLAFTAAVPFIGRWSDVIGRRRLMIASAIVPAVLTYPAFELIATKTLGGAVAGQVILALSTALWAGVAPATLAEIFPTRLRATSLSIGYSIAVAVFGGFSPLLITYLDSVMSALTAPVLYLVGAAVLTLIATLFLPETARGPLLAT